jgi:predicted glycogen debranching enzyme
MSPNMNPTAEWLESDGLGGFASGTVSGIRTRRYHALLLPATTPPAGRFVLVNGFEAWVTTPAGSFPITSQAYAPDVVHPDGSRRIQSFETDPWPRWTFRLEDGTEIVQEIFVTKGAPVTAISWKLSGRSEGVTLSVRPLLSGRDYHQMHHGNSAFRFDAETGDGRIAWRPYPGVPGVVAVTNGAYTHQPDWFSNFLYKEELARGLDCTEDLASPGVVSFDLSRKEAVLILAAEGPASAESLGASKAEAFIKSARAAEKKRRAKLSSPLLRAADAYVVERGSGRTIVAGYPWFTDWGRDTFIALRGLCLAAGDLDTARAILLEWSSVVSEGMLPNRFPDQGDTPEYNSVDASLWYVIAVHDLLRAADAGKKKVPAEDRKKLLDAVEAILDGYSRGTRYGIRLDSDGLIAAGAPGVQLTWMDAKVGDWVVTPRMGKPVEVQALWLNALRLASEGSERWNAAYERGAKSFRARFWNDDRGCLYDVVDVDHVPGKVDATFRPNQIFAVGGLPFALLEGDRARRVVDAVESRLVTLLGLRSLAPGEPGYAPRYEGGVVQRDGSYHQGTVWPWLMSAFVEAWIRVRGGAPEIKREAREKFLAPLLGHLDDAGLGHISEIADAEAPHTPRGCPFQAWSVGEALRLDQSVLAEEAATAPRPRASKAAAPAVKKALVNGAPRRRTTAT